MNIGAQNLFWETKGAFTGEISPVKAPFVSQKRFCAPILIFEPLTSLLTA
ncbi:MAG: triose-phosphate isomerase [Endomicrobium sp.]|nr:triose-phosphate isomerase [Endomicrobium sp.]